VFLHESFDQAKLIENSPMKRMQIGVVVIGRNEGDRLLNCLDSIHTDKSRVVYVDSGSTDNSVQEALRRGVDVVSLDMTIPFTAARSRNEGWIKLIQQHPDTDLIQFIDGDCELDSQWLTVATQFLENNSAYAVVCGRRREKHPENSVYNHLCDIEWDTPIGDAKACGGDAMFRAKALQQVGGFNGQMIAGEEPELCVRMRQAGYRIRRIDHEMTRHDAAIMKFSQWWQRTKRAGFAFACGAAMHGAYPERHWVQESRRAILWGLILPACCMLGGLFVSPLLWAGFAAYPLQVLRLWLRHRDLALAWFTTLGKFAEAQGILKYMLNKKSRLIEYKQQR
jgi:GT2 family glycosyltransferase